MDVIMPQLGETVLEGVITAWYKKPGEPVAADESLFEVETDKVTTAIPSPVPGVVREILVDAGVAVKVGTRLAVIDSASEVVAAPVAPADRSASRKLSPVVRRLLAESGLTPQDVQGTGRDGRITREDVLQRMARAAPSAVPPPAPQPATPSPDDRVVPLNKIRRATASHMTRSIATSAHTLQAVEVDFQNVERVRNARGADWKAREGFALTYLPFVCAATCEALAEFPLINATFGNDALIVHRRINLGIAVDLGFEGLLVPVVRDANHKNAGGLAREINSLVQKARANSLSPDEVSGGTYTISNSGSFGTLITAPIIHQPQVAIVSLDGVHKKPVVIEGPDGDAIAIRPIGVLAQSFDHRAFDGAYSAAFLRRLKQALETRNWLVELN
jgi:pyruvate dehydrogenase E2 component (dihydrolipoamide acetyltransferase)